MCNYSSLYQASPVILSLTDQCIDRTRYVIILGQYDERVRGSCESLQLRNLVPTRFLGMLPHGCHRFHIDETRSTMHRQVNRLRSNMCFVEQLCKGYR